MKIFLIIPILVTLISCNKTALDKEIYKEVIDSDYTYYQNGSILESQAGSPHGRFKLKFNSIAVSVLDSTGELPVGATFPDGSVIVKEVLDDKDKLDLYAIMKKDSLNPESGISWLWAEYKPNGKVIISVSEKGSQCTGCHSITPNRDGVRTFDLH